MIMNPRRVLTVVLALALVVTASGLAQQTAEELYQAGLYQEEVQGNLESAIDLYRRILDEFSDNRTVGAKAQLHIGLCYEKLGLQEAQQAYRLVIDDFPEHTDEVAVARDRLAGIARALAELNRQPTFRKIEIASKPRNGVLSPDGNKLAFISEGAVWVVPLHGRVGPDIAGEPVRLAEVPGVWDTGSLMAWSADGEWIAVNGEAEADGGTTVHVVPAGGGEPRLVRMPPRRGHAWSHRVSLSPDGRSLAFSALEPATSEDAIYVLPTGGGELQRLTFASSRMPAFSPDGEFIAFVGYSENDDGPEKAERPDVDLWVVPSDGGAPVKLTNVDGRLRGPVWSPDGEYIATHHEPVGGNPSDEIWVYPLSRDASSAGAPEKIVLPRASYYLVAGWTPDDELGVFIESEAHNAIYTVGISGGKAVQVTPEGGPYYPRWSPDGERIYLRWFFGEGDTGRVRDLLAGYEATAFVPATGGDVVEIPVQSERELGPGIPGGGLNVSPDGKRIVISAAQLPWDPEEGLDIWSIPVDGGPPIRLTSDRSHEGYPCWSPDGGWVAFKDWHAKSDDEGFDAIYMVPAGGGEIRQITSEADSVGDGAIAFAPGGERIAFFSGGAIKTIPVEGGQPEVLVAEVRSGRHSQLAWSPDGLKIAHNAEGTIWITPLDGGAPEELRTGLPEDAELSDFSWSPDGERIAFSGRIGGDAEFWLISDFLPSRDER
jgi:Tol biopolymer transport system component